MCTSLGGTPVAALTNYCTKVPRAERGWPSRPVFVDGHRDHLSHGLIDALDATVAVRVVGARRKVPHAWNIVHGK